MTKDKDFFSLSLYLSLTLYILRLFPIILCAQYSLLNRAVSILHKLQYSCLSVRISTILIYIHFKIALKHRSHKL